MLNKRIKLCQIALLGLILFGILPFRAQAYSPYVTTGSATAITSYSVTLNGSVNADNMPTSVWFEYGTDNSLRGYQSVTAYRVTSGNSGNIIASVSGLYPNTTYYFRAVAQNLDGRSYGNIYLFTTSYNYPVFNDNSYVVNNYYSVNTTAITEPASSIGSMSVQLNSLVYSGGEISLNTYFEWGATANLGYRTETVSVGTLPSVRHADKMTGLNPNTKYYFRAVTENSSGRTNGSILSFTTSGAKQNTQTSGTISTDTSNTPAVEKKEVTPSSLAANVLGAGSFLPTSILGWMVLLILILVLIILSKHFMRTLAKNKPAHTGEHI